MRRACLIRFYAYVAWLYEVHNLFCTFTSACKSNTGYNAYLVEIFSGTLERMRKMLMKKGSGPIPKFPAGDVTLEEGVVKGRTWIGISYAPRTETTRHA
jgi:hypothetical protein